MVALRATFVRLMELPFGKVEAYYDGKDGWFASPQGMMAMPPPVAKQIQGEQIPRVNLRSFSATAIRNRTVAAVGENAVEISDKPGNSVRVDLDPATGCLRKMHYRSDWHDRGPTAVYRSLSDFGKWLESDLPHKVAIEQNGQKFAEATVTEMEDKFRPQRLRSSRRNHESTVALAALLYLLRSA